MSAEGWVVIASVLGGYALYFIVSLLIRWSSKKRKKEYARHERERTQNMLTGGGSRTRLAAAVWLEMRNYPHEPYPNSLVTAFSLVPLAAKNSGVTSKELREIFNWEEE